MHHYRRQRSFDSLSSTSPIEDAQPIEEEEDSLLAAIGRATDTEDEPIDLPLAKRARHSEETSHPLIELLQKTVDHFATWLPGDRLSGLDMNILDNITRMCGASPQLKNNQIAVACRRLNVAWRRRKMPLVKKLFSALLEAAWPENALNILEIVDIP